MLNHATDESDNGKGNVLDLFGAMVTVPIVDGGPVIAFDASDRDGRSDDVFCEIMRQSFPSGRDLAFLNVSNEASGVLPPCFVNILLDGGLGGVGAEHGEEMVLPFAVDHLEWDVRNIPPLSLGIDSSGSNEDMQMRVEIAGPACGLEDDDGADIEIDPGTCFEDVQQTFVACSHEM